MDVGSDYDSYKTFEIDFENSPSMFSPFLSLLASFTDITCYRPRQFYSQVGRSHARAQTAAHEAQPDPGGHGVGGVYGASGTGRFHVKRSIWMMGYLSICSRYIYLCVWGFVVLDTYLPLPTLGLFRGGRKGGMLSGLPTYWRGMDYERSVC